MQNWAFGRAFDAARSAGLEGFTWCGKAYTTRHYAEPVHQWRAKLAANREVPNLKENV